jgi:hypothetical protein
MIAKTVKLLKYTPEEALLLIANDSLGTSLSPDNAIIEKIVGISGTLTECTVAGKVLLAGNCANSYEKQSVFMFNRLDLETVFGNPFEILGALPTTVNNVLKQITKTSGIVFDENDFEDGVLNTTPITLLPSSSSRRWIGQLDIVLTV